MACRYDPGLNHTSGETMRHTAAAALAAVCLALAGCSSDGDAKAETKPSAAKPKDPADEFMASVTDAHLDSWAEGFIRVPPRDELTAFPPQWCEKLDAEHSVPWILDQMELYPVGENWGTVKTDAYQLVLLGTKAYCPEHVERVRLDLRNSGEY
jgi:hypothetical protein